MKAFMIIAALVASTPALAQTPDFTGPRIEATASAADVTNVRERSDIDYGVAVGFDVPLGKSVIAGVEASSDNPFDRDRTIGAAARLGYVVNDRLMLYGKAGYENYRLARNLKLDGLRLGVGAEVNLTSNTFAKIEGRYTDFENGVGRYGAQAGIGLRF